MEHVLVGISEQCSEQCYDQFQRMGCDVKKFACSKYLA
jgi:hypothetical protein